MSTTVRKLTDAQVAEIRAACQQHRATKAKVIAAKYGISAATVYLIANGREYRVPFTPTETP
jgi:DNA-binding Xre family transcriptional regulator